MTSTAHALVAGAIATKFTDPVTAGFLVLTSHYIMDSIPHWDFGTNWRTRAKNVTGAFALAETTLGIWISYVFFGSALPFTHWAGMVIICLLPDWIETPWYIFFANQKKQIPGPHALFFETASYSIYKYQSFFHSKAQFPLGVFTQIITVVFFIVLLG